MHLFTEAIFAAVQDAHIGVVNLHPAVAQVDKRVGRLDTLILQLAKMDHRGGIARLAVFKVGAPREMLPGGCLTPALDDAFVGFVEGVLEVQQCNHSAQRHARSPSVAGLGHALHPLTEQIQIGHGHASSAFARENLRDPRFDLLPGHARGQHRPRVAQVDHGIDAQAEKIVGGGAGVLRKTPRHRRSNKLYAGRATPEGRQNTKINQLIMDFLGALMHPRPLAKKIFISTARGSSAPAVDSLVH